MNRDDEKLEDEKDCYLYAIKMKANRDKQSWMKERNLLEERNSPAYSLISAGRHINVPVYLPYAISIAALTK